MHAFTHSYIHICLSFVYMYSFLCFVIFYLSLSFLAFMHFYHMFLACSIYSFRYVYHIFISYNLIFISCHLLVTSYILLTYIDRPKTWYEKCTPMCASARVAPSNIVYLWYGYRSTGIDVLTTENCFSNVIWIYVMYKD